MNEGALTLAVGAAGFAALCAVADGALLSLEPATGNEPRLHGLYAEREAIHRTLSFARVLLHLTAGAGVALAFDLAHLPAFHTAAIGIGWAILVVAFAENMARALGDSVGAPAILRLHMMVRALERAEALVRVLTSISLELKTEIRFIPNDKKLIKPDVKASVGVKRAEEEEE